MKTIILLAILGGVISGTLSIFHQTPTTEAEQRSRSENLETVRQLLARQNWWLVRHDTVSSAENGEGRKLTFILSPSSAEQFRPPRGTFGSLVRLFPQGPKSLQSLGDQFHQAWRGQFPRVEFEEVGPKNDLTKNHPRVCCDKLRIKFTNPLP